MNVAKDGFFMLFRCCEILVDSEDVVSDITALCQKLPVIKKWAYIEHRKDGVDAHFHICLDFGKNSVSSSTLERAFDFKFFSILPIRGCREDSFLYLIHGLDSAREKYQYSPEDVVANFDYVSFVKNRGC